MIVMVDFNRLLLFELVVLRSVTDDTIRYGVVALFCRQYCDKQSLRRVFFCCYFTDVAPCDLGQCCCQGLETRGRGLENWSLRILEDNNTAVGQYDEIDMNLNLTGAQWQISHPFVTQSLQDDGT